jgi:hypothetical protein
LARVLIAARLITNIAKGADFDTYNPKVDELAAGIGRILSVTHRPGGHMPTWDLKIEVKSYDDAAAKEAFPHSVAVDCFSTIDEADRRHAVDFVHFARHGYGRSHWRRK